MALNKVTKKTIAEELAKTRQAESPASPGEKPGEIRNYVDYEDHVIVITSDFRKFRFTVQALEAAAAEKKA